VTRAEPTKPISAHCSPEIAKLVGARLVVEGIDTAAAAVRVRNREMILLVGSNGTMWLWPVVREMRRAVIRKRNNG